MLAQHPASRLRIPIVDGGEYHKDKAADQRVMEVRYHEIGVSQLPVEGRGTQHDTGQAGDEELKQKPQAKHHRRFEADLASVKSPQPVEDLDSGRHANEQRRRYEKRVAHRCHADTEHVMGPDSDTDETDEHCRGNHSGIAEDRLARKNRDDLRSAGESRNNQDVNLWMSEQPEKVLPQYGRASRLRIEEVRAQESIQQQHDLR